MRGKYGDNEHQAAVAICRGLGCSGLSVQIVDDLEWDNIPNLLNEKKYASFLAIYCDMRIGLNGIQPLIGRLEDLEKRSSLHKRGHDRYVANGLALEREISKNVSIDVNTVPGTQIHDRFEKLLDLNL